MNVADWHTVFKLEKIMNDAKPERLDREESFLCGKILLRNAKKTLKLSSFETNSSSNKKHFEGIKSSLRKFLKDLKFSSKRV